MRSFQWSGSSQAQAPPNDVYILAHTEYVVRTARDEVAIAAAMRDFVRRVDPDLPTGTIASLDDAVLNTMDERLFQTRLLTVFAVLALIPARRAARIDPASLLRTG